jgi:hypothetical protein
MLVGVLGVLALTPLTASADSFGFYYNSGNNWHPRFHSDYEAERGLPFRWHDHYEAMRVSYHMERIHEVEWGHRFPGTIAYRWHGPGFWHHGHYVTDAVFFYNGNGELVSVGYMVDGVFIHFRDDHECYENHDSFFVSWWSH